MFEGIVPLFRKVQILNTNVLSRDLREEVAGVQSRELELAHKKSDLEKQLELAEAETISVRNELKIAQRRIEDLQVAIQGDMDTSVGESGDSEEEDTGDAEVWLAEARRRMVRGGSVSSRWVTVSVRAGNKPS